MTCHSAASEIPEWVNTTASGDFARIRTRAASCTTARALTSAASVTRPTIVIGSYGNLSYRRNCQFAAALQPATLQRSLAEARSILNGFDDNAMMTNWRLTRGGKDILSLPRIGVIRTIMLNHWYHHRGQPVYLRLLNVPVPSIYGPSADENPFA